LISAPAFHGITTEIPHEVFIAIRRGAGNPALDYPPLSVHRFCEASLEAGVEKHEVDGVAIQVYSPGKTLADCFKFRNKLGMDVVLEALRLYKTKKRQ